MRQASEQQQLNHHPDPLSPAIHSNSLVLTPNITELEEQFSNFEAHHSATAYNKQTRNSTSQSVTSSKVNDLINEAEAYI